MAGRILPSSQQNTPIGQKGGCLPVCRRMGRLRAGRKQWYGYVKKKNHSQNANQPSSNHLLHSQ
jgi:hypothetical protein